MFKPNFDKGKAYLKKAGTDVFAIVGGVKMVFSPGSAYEDINKEKLPEKYTIDGLKKEYSFSKAFKKHFKVTHHVDMERLLRASSILITNFEGPESEDNMKKHLERLFFHFSVQTGTICVQNVSDALMAFGEILKIKKRPEITLQEYDDAARIIGHYFKLWNYDNPIDAFFGTEW